VNSNSRKPEVLLEAWQLVELHQRPFYLMGFVTGHPTMSGFRRRARTSLVLSFDEAGGRAETVNTCYRLAHPVTDMTFHPDGSGARITLGGFTADRVFEGADWFVMHGMDPVGTVPSPKPVDAIYRLLSLATGIG
jgi:hypothetical protein